MAEYLIQDTSLTALADEIRELSGTTNPKSLDAMTSDVDAANTEIAEQAELLNQIATALEGKASNPGGVVLPKLNNPASASDILSGKEAINGSGNKITGTITTQAAKTITPSTSSQTAVAKNVYTTGAITVAAIPSNYEDVATETSAYTTKLASLETAITALETELAGKASGGSGGSSGGIEFEIINIPVGAYSASYTLPRVTSACGSITSSFETDTDTADYLVLSILNTRIYYIDGLSGYSHGSSSGAELTVDNDLIEYNSGTITWYAGKIDIPITLLLINDPNQPAISL